MRVSGIRALDLATDVGCPEKCFAGEQIAPKFHNIPVCPETQYTLTGPLMAEKKGYRVSVAGVLSPKCMLLLHQCKYW